MNSSRSRYIPTLQTIPEETMPLSRTRRCYNFQAETPAETINLSQLPEQNSLKNSSQS